MPLLGSGQRSCRRRGQSLAWGGGDSLRKREGAVGASRGRAALAEALSWEPRE